MNDEPKPFESSEPNSATAPSTPEPMEPEPSTAPNPSAPPPPAAITVLRGRVTEQTANLDAQWRAREAAHKRKEQELAQREDNVSRIEKAFRRAAKARPEPEKVPWWRNGGSSILGD